MRPSASVAHMGRRGMSMEAVAALGAGRGRDALADAVTQRLELLLDERFRHIEASVSALQHDVTTITDLIVMDGGPAPMLPERIEQEMSTNNPRPMLHEEITRDNSSNNPPAAADGSTASSSPATTDDEIVQ